MRPILLDTGPLVASLDRRDKYHEWAVTQLSAMTQPLLTCETVLAEACFLVRHLPDGGPSVLQLIERKVIVVDFRIDTEVSQLGELMKKYASVPMSLADACLVRMAELHPNSKVFTLDSDFRIYRKNRRQTIPVIMPDDLG